MTAQSLNIYLAKQKFTKAGDIVKDPQTARHYAIGQDGRIGDLYIPRSREKQPDWAGFFADYVKPDDFGLVTSAGALFVVRHGERIFAITFGTGRFLLKPDCWEDRFGLRAALNCIGDNTVKSIDKHTLDPLARHTREQASKQAPASEFGLNIEQDLLRGVTGTPKDAAFGKWVTGMEALRLAVPLTIHDLDDLLERVYAKYLDTSYRKTFPWVDQIAEVRDAGLQNTLTNLLVQRLRAGRKENTWMAVPEVIAWSEVSGFRFPARSGPKVAYHDVHLDYFLASLTNPAAIDESLLHNRVVECHDDAGKPLHQWKAFKCLYCELEHAGDAYLLSGGNWYLVKRDFVEQVNEAFSQIPDYDRALPEYSDKSEGSYVTRIAKSAPDSFTAMDGKFIMYGGGASKIEFCDLLTRHHDLVHIKRYGQSAVLSHLFAQGLTSGELLQTDPDFRHALNKKLPEAHRLPDPAIPPRQGHYRVVFAIVSDRVTCPHFPHGRDLRILQLSSGI